MTPRNHNKTLGLAHGLVGLLFLTGLIIYAGLEANRRPSEAAQRLGWVLFALMLPLLQLITSYGLLAKRRLGRVLALLLSVLYLWVFPLGTLLAIYTWWFLHGEAGKQLYAKNET